MAEAKPKNWRRWIGGWALLVVVVVVVTLLGVALWLTTSVLPPALVNQNTRPDISNIDRLKEIDAVRASLLGPLTTLVGALAVLTGAGVAYFNFRGTLELNRRGQVTERFTKANEQLGAYTLGIRLGAVYALEQIAKDSEELHWPVMQTLAAFVRQHNQEAVPSTAAAEDPLYEDEEEEEILGHPLVLGSPSDNDTERPPAAAAVEEIDQAGAMDLELRGPADYLAVADVIRRRRWEWDPARRDRSGALRPEPLDLRGADLRRGHFEAARLQGAYFGRAQLQGTHFTEAHLQRADFTEAHLERAEFVGAQLQGTKFRGARLDGAHLEGVDVSETVELTEDQLNLAKFDKYTKLPLGLQPGTLDARPGNSSSLV